MKAAERRATPTDENNRAAITTAAVGHFGAIVGQSMDGGGEAPRGEGGRDESVFLSDILTSDIGLAQTATRRQKCEHQR